MEENKAQRKIKLLLRLERSTPKVLYQGTDMEVIEWTLPNGLVHRDYGPAQECVDGVQIWYQNGVTHREDGPAEIYGDNKVYCLFGCSVSKDDFANQVESIKSARKNGDKVFKIKTETERIVYFNGHLQCHREDGPAMIYVNGNELWIQKNKRHREDGPAEIFKDSKIENYWIRGKQLTMSEFEQWKQKNKKK